MLLQVSRHQGRGISMTDSYLPLKGKVIILGQLKIRWAQDLAYYLETGIANFAKFIECRVTDDGKELIIVDIDVEIGQHLVHDIRRIERIVVEFSNDNSIPEVLALRSNFPRVPHINLRSSEFPRSLCLFEERYDDLKLYWTSAFFIKRISEWLKLTARGALHQEDQPLEPLLSWSGLELIIPFDLFKDSKQMSEELKVYRAEKRSDGLTLIAKYSSCIEDVDAIDHGYIAIPISGQPQVHGVIRRLPETLQELHDFLSTAQINLIEEIQKYLSTILRENRYTSKAKSRLILIIDLPKKRREDSAAEDSEVLAFGFLDLVEKVGVSLGVWELNNGKPGILFNGKVKDTSIKIISMKVMSSFSRELASALNAINPATYQITLIGVGALGSQVFLNLIRAGYGIWTLIDHDRLLPHNLARHALFGAVVGNSKAEYLSMLANDILDGQEPSKHITADVLNPGKYKGDVEQSLKKSDVIVDISTSIAVARYLARNVKSEARRASLFLTPSGEDSVMLIEDKRRQIPLDLVEMQYYRLLLHNERLKTHLSKFSGKIRYANSCRDITSLVPQDMVALHAAICSRALRFSIENEDAYIKIWKLNPSDLTVESFAFKGIKAIEFHHPKWTVCTDQYLVDKLYELRTTKLPNETGGILLGSFDMDRKIVYIMDTIASPPDSEEWPTLYIRGCQGLSRQLEEVANLTAGRLQYIGEWHSHPAGSEAKPSSDDRAAFGWLTGHMKVDGYPAVMLIVGERGYSIYVENIQ